MSQASTIASYTLSIVIIQQRGPQDNALSPPSSSPDEYGSSQDKGYISSSLFHHL